MSIVGCGKSCETALSAGFVHQCQGEKWFAVTEAFKHAVEWRVFRVWLEMQAWVRASMPLKPEWRGEDMQLFFTLSKVLLQNINHLV